MTEQELEQLDDAPEIVICGANLTNKTPRTLIWGYDTNRNSWHVYLGEDGLIHLYHYGYQETDLYLEYLGDDSKRAPKRHLTETDIKSNEEYVPNKRIYPEASDYEFCRLLKEFDVYLPFTAYNHERDLTKQFHGKVVSQVLTQ